jgi:hypothetical protein
MQHASIVDELHCKSDYVAVLHGASTLAQAMCGCLLFILDLC